MTHRVEIFRRAAREIEAHFDHLAARSMRTAVSWRTGLLAAVASLAELPERCPLAPESEWYDGVRELYYGKRRDVFRVMFCVRSDTVYVLRVRHGRQDLLSPGEL